jgi:osmotically inducible protein OsmC
MAVLRSASVTWTGNLANGNGTINNVTSGAFGDLPVSWPARTEEPNGKTSPEELIAAAHAACFSMALSGRLTRNETPPEQLSVTATVTFDKTDAGWRIASSALTVRGTVPGIDAETFRSLAESAKDGCPVSTALKGNVDLSVDAALA